MIFYISFKVLFAFLITIPSEFILYTQYNAPKLKTTVSGIEKPKLLFKHLSYP